MSRRAEWVGAALLGLVAIPVFFAALGSYGLVNGDEGFYHAVARRMAETGQWHVLEFAGTRRLYDTVMNAPIQYWLRGLVILAFGDNYWTMRVLSAASGLGTVLVTWRLGRRCGGARAGLLAGAIQLTTLQFVFLHSARTGELEAVLSLVFALCALLFVQAVEGERSFLAHHACLALLPMLKLPMLLIPLLAEAAFLALHPRYRRRLRDWIGLGLLVAPFALAWHLAQLFLLGDAFFREIARMRGEAAGAAGGLEGLWVRLENLRFYAEAILFGAFPYALAYPLALVAMLRSGGREQRERWRLLALYAGATLLFFTLVDRRHPWYVIPAYPMLSCFLGAWLADLFERLPGRILVAAIGLAVGLSLGLSVGVLDFDPFAVRAARIAMPLGWRASASWSVPLVALLVAGGVEWMRRRRPALAARTLALALCALLLGYGALRIGSALRFTDHVSGFERLSRRLAAARAAGEPIRYPVAVTGAGYFKTFYVFGDDYRIQVPRDTTHGTYLLYPRAEGGAPEPGVRGSGPRPPAAGR